MFSSVLYPQIEGMAREEIPAISRLSSILCLIYEDSPQINWAGLYLYDKDKEAAFLGPFFGKPACLEIPRSKGVIGAAIRSGQTQRIDDVHAVADHIACDAASASECVVCLRDENQEIIAVLDIDSSVPSFFTESDQLLLEKTGRLIEPMLSCISW